MAPRPISIVVMQQFSKLQRTVQFCYWALNYLEIPDSSNVQVAEWSNARVCKTLITVGSNPTLNFGVQQGMLH